ncbi:MAG TPA: hypothetical protein VMV92_04175 [Streptosporangiaceae bacterium]|nr:hypothetical protein [Streptosporangiaceae bacterium]
MLPVKENRRALSGAPGALPWGQVPIVCTATDKGHGQITTRTIRVLPAPEDLPLSFTDGKPTRTAGPSGPRTGSGAAALLR